MAAKKKIPMTPRESKEYVQYGISAHKERWCEEDQILADEYLTVEHCEQLLELAKRTNVPEPFKHLAQAILDSERRRKGKGRK